MDMDDMEKEKVSQEAAQEQEIKAIPPEEFTGIHLSNPKKNAVGAPALVAAMGHAFKYMNPSAGVKTMYKVN